MSKWDSQAPNWERIPSMKPQHQPWARTTFSPLSSGGSPRRKGARPGCSSVGFGSDQVQEEIGAAAGRISRGQATGVAKRKVLSSETSALFGNGIRFPDESSWKSGSRIDSHDRPLSVTKPGNPKTKLGPHRARLAPGRPWSLSAIAAGSVPAGDIPCRTSAGLRQGSRRGADFGNAVQAPQCRTSLAAHNPAPPNRKVRCRSAARVFPPTLLPGKGPVPSER
jgi:hypothetical protein